MTRWLIIHYYLPHIANEKRNMSNLGTISLISSTPVQCHEHKAQHKSDIQVDFIKYNGNRHRSFKQTNWSFSHYVLADTNFRRVPKGTQLYTRILLHENLYFFFHCFTVHFDSLSFIHTNSCTFFIQLCISLLSYIKIT